MSEMTPRYVGMHPALGAPFHPRQSQATRNDLYYPAALECERAARQASALEACKERRARRVYQLLALLGWAAVVVMGVVL